MKKNLYIECNSGISGDMTVGALLDLGADKKALDRALNSIEAEGFKIVISKVKKSGLLVTDFDVVLDHDHDGHDHDMDYLYGHLSAHQSIEESHHHEHNMEHNHEHHYAENHEHNEMHIDEHHHHHGEESHHHMHRGMKEINEILDKVDMTPNARKICDKIFSIVAEAEAQVHGTTIEEVHFHEVGAIDSIVDIVAVAVLIDSLGVDEIFVTPLAEGCGTVRCQHGILPVPVPAVAAIAAKHSLTLEMTGIPGELVTPTGAAIAAALRTSSKLPKTFVIEKIGMGAGKRETGLAGIVRAMLITTDAN